MSMAASVSVSVPIWLGLIRIALAMCLSMPSLQDLGVGDEQVVADQLDLACPSARVSIAQPSQSPSPMPSSIVMIGYLRRELREVVDELAPR